MDKKDRLVEWIEWRYKIGDAKKIGRTYINKIIRAGSDQPNI
jgi:hypothetical protein